MKRPLISFIVPAYNEAENLKWLHRHVSSYLSTLPIDYEIIYINDGSKDDSINVLRALYKSEKKHMRYLSFSRNFGKEAATTAGLHAAKGDAAIMIDADGQHPIEVVKTFIEEWQNGYATVIGIRKNDGHGNIIKALGSKFFYAALRSLDSNDSSQDGLTDFRIIDRKIIDEYKKMTEHNRVTRNLLDWLGYSRKLVPFEAEERHAGKASYDLRKLTRMAIDGIVKQSTKPLKLIGVLGGLVSIVSLFMFIFAILEKYPMGDPLHLAITGTAILAMFISFMIGIILVCQGLLALYIESVYYETQNRPVYVVEEEA